MAILRLGWRCRKMRTKASKSSSHSEPPWPTDWLCGRSSVCVFPSFPYGPWGFFLKKKKKNPQQDQRNVRETWHALNAAGCILKESAAMLVSLLLAWEWFHPINMWLQIMALYKRNGYATLSGGPVRRPLSSSKFRILHQTGRQNPTFCVAGLESG